LQANQLRWVCGHAPPPVDAIRQSGTTSAAQTSLPEGFLPEACRSDPSSATQVLDALLGTSHVRLSITEFWATAGTLPASLAEAGLHDPLPVARARLHLHEGVLVAVFVGNLDGERLGLAPWERDGMLHWVCGHAEPPPGAVPLGSSTASAQTTLDIAMLPQACR
jgi:hypothetical protein